MSRKPPEYKRVKYYYDEELADLLSSKIAPVYPEFDGRSFSMKVAKRVPDFKYKDRVRVFAAELRDHLPDRYSRALKILMKILGPENEGETGMFTEGYWLSPVAMFVELYGLGDYDISMQAIAEITKRHTSEYAVRPYLEKYEARALKQMLAWSTDENFHVRRLASEGVRPRLPWATKLPVYIDNPDLIVPVLENLKSDPVKYVQKSVANCINDILKDNEDIALTLISRWAKDKPGKETKWIIKHSLRRLRKAKDPRAMKIIAKIS